MTERASRAREVPAWPLRRRFTAGVVLATVIVAALTAVVVVSFDQVGAAQAKVTQEYFTAVRASGTLLTAYLDQETGVRGYLLTGDARFRVPYDDGRAQEENAAAGLRGALSGDVAVVARLDRVRADARAWRVGYAEPAIALVRTGRRGEVTTGQQDAGRQLFDQLRGSYAGYEQALVDARAAAVADLSAGRTVLGLAFGALAAFVVVALVGLGLALGRWILSPLDALRADVGAVAEGDLDREITPRGPPDLRQVALDVERMRLRLLGSYRDQVEALRTVEHQRELLEQQTGELSRSNAELEQFAYVASHDLQEPLRKVASFTELLQRRYAGRLDERADSYIEFAVDGAHRMQGLISDLLAFSRVGRVGAAPGQVRLADALDGARRNLAAVIEETGAQLRTPGPDQLPTVPGDRGLLTQVFQNLLGNALKFRRPGEPPAVQVSCHRDGECWRIDVADNGIGIDAEYADRVFVIFSRLNRREDYPGSGIGLALCKKIVEYHGGHIELAPHQGPGTTISLTLPAGAGHAPKEAE